MITTKKQLKKELRELQEKYDYMCKEHLTVVEALEKMTEKKQRRTHITNTHDLEQEILLWQKRYKDLNSLYKDLIQDYKELRRTIYYE